MQLLATVFSAQNDGDPAASNGI